MSDERKIHSFLYGSGSEHRKTRLTACHNVGMIAENVKSVSCNRSRADVENGGEQFARYFIHVGDHKQ